MYSYLQKCNKLNKSHLVGQLLNSLRCVLRGLEFSVRRIVVPIRQSVYAVECFLRTSSAACVKRALPREYENLCRGQEPSRTTTLAWANQRHETGSVREMKSLGNGEL